MGGSPTVALIVGIVSIALGIVYLAVARGLARGSDVSRMLVAIVSGVSLAGGLYTVVTASGSAQLSGWSAILWSVVILGILTRHRRTSSSGPDPPHLRHRRSKATSR